eukprot:4563573-Amphidinium_carterae.2
MCCDPPPAMVPKPLFPRESQSCATVVVIATFEWLNLVERGQNVPPVRVAELRPIPHFLARLKFAFCSMQSVTRASAWSVVVEDADYCRGEGDVGLEDLCSALDKIRCQT